MSDFRCKISDVMMSDFFRSISRSFMAPAFLILTFPYFHISTFF